MRSNLAKVLHPLLEKPMIYYVLKQTLLLQPRTICVVVGHQATEVEDQVKALFPQETKNGVVRFALQKKQRGTADAVYAAKESLATNIAQTLILNGDGPLITVETLLDLVTTKHNKQSPLALLSFEPENNYGYGRIVRQRDNRLLEKIVEEEDASEAEKEIKECNAGTYVIDNPLLFQLRGRDHAK